MQIYKNNYINKRDKIHKIKIKFFFLYFKDYVDYYYFFLYIVRMFVLII